MLDDYAEAFSGYLRTGAVDPLAGFCGPGADPARLAIYRNGFFKACADALRSNYPSVARLVGEACFGALARGYVEAHPPRTATLVEYGREFPAFAARTADTHGLDYLASVAALDRAWTEVWFAADAAPSDPRALARLAGDAAAILEQRCRLAPAVRIVALDCTALEAWQCLRDGPLEGPIEILPEPRRVLVWRCDGVVSSRDLAPAEHAFVAALAAGLACGEAAEAGIALDAGFDPAAPFAALLHHRILTFDTTDPGAST